MNLPLSKQCVSLEIANTLQELGFNKESYFSWVKNFHTNDPWELEETEHVIGMNEDSDSRRLEPIYKIGAPAFTASELMELLPFVLADKNDEIMGYLTVDKARDVYHVSYQGIEKLGHSHHLQTAETLADALGLMYIHLLETKIISL